VGEAAVSPTARAAVQDNAMAGVAASPTPPPPPSDTADDALAVGANAVPVRIMGMGPKVGLAGMGVNAVTRAACRMVAQCTTSMCPMRKVQWLGLQNTTSASNCMADTSRW